MKIIQKSLIHERNLGPSLKKEILILKMINHEFIVDVKAVFSTMERLYIIMEYVGGGELFDRIVDVGRFNPPTARHYFKQLLQAVEYIHKIGVCHRDLKPENLLLDDAGNIKVSDFGFAIAENSPCGEVMSNLHSTCGTPNYVAPEVVSKVGYDGRKADIWSMGVVSIDNISAITILVIFSSMILIIYTDSFCFARGLSTI